MNKVMKTVILTLIGAGCFSGGIYYGVERSEQSLERVMEEYEVISDKVDAFEKAADPKSIRLYVKELNKETDDNLELIQELQKKIQEQNDYINKLNVELGQSITQLEEDMNTIKNSTYWLRDKKIWRK